MDFLWLKDPKNGNKSVTLTLFVYGFIVVTSKLFLSGVEVMDKFKMSEFSGSEYAICVTALGAIYITKRHSSFREDTKDKKE